MENGEQVQNEEGEVSMSNEKTKTRYWKSLKLNSQGKIESAARSAESAAWSAARKKMKEKIQKWFVRHIVELAEIPR